jgi:glycolate oxidase FAD binding subunit
MSNNSTIAATLGQILAPSSIGTWEDLSPQWQGTISRAIIPNCNSPHVALTHDALPLWVAPKTEAELAEVVTCAHRNRWRLLPCGQGSKLGWGRQTQGIDLVLSTSHLDRIIDHAVGDLTLTAEAGLGLAALQSTLANHNQFLALDPIHQGTASLGGTIATADSGALRHRYGGVRDMLLGVQFVRADGQIAKAGGRVVKNVAGYDLMKLFTGSYGSLGILTQATFRLYPIPDQFHTMVLMGEAQALRQVTRTLLNSALTPVAIDLLSAPLLQALDLGSTMALAVRFGTVEAGVQEQVQRLTSLTQSHSLQISHLTATPEQQFWQQIPELLLQLPEEPSEQSVLCKVGLLPTGVVDLLQQLEPSTLSPALVAIRAGSGLGLVRLPQGLDAQGLQTIRNICQTQGGFLTLLEAPTSLKHQVDVWGYGNGSLGVMEKIKHQFDPKSLLCPQRFP